MPLPGVAADSGRDPSCWLAVTSSLLPWRSSRSALIVPGGVWNWIFGRFTRRGNPTPRQRKAKRTLQRDLETMNTTMTTTKTTMTPCVSRVARREVLRTATETMRITFTRFHESFPPGRPRNRRKPKRLKRRNCLVSSQSSLARHPRQITWRYPWARQSLWATTITITRTNCSTTWRLFGFCRRLMLLQMLRNQKIHHFHRRCYPPREKRLPSVPLAEFRARSRRRMPTIALFSPLMPSWTMVPRTFHGCLLPLKETMELLRPLSNSTKWLTARARVCSAWKPTGSNNPLFLVSRIFSKIWDAKKSPMILFKPSQQRPLGQQRV